MPSDFSTFWRTVSPILGNRPLESKRTKVRLDLDSNNLNFGGWTAERVGMEDSRMDVRIKTSSWTPIGSWNLKVLTSWKKSLVDSDSVWPVYGIHILFNPWSKGEEKSGGMNKTSKFIISEDQTFMENTEEREEYVLNDAGKIWRGTHKSIEPCPWLYGQVNG